MELEELYELEKTKKLTPKQERFCQEYVLCLIGSAAYKKVYTGVTDESAKASAARLLSNVNVQARVRELQEEMNEKYKINAGFLIAKSIEVIQDALVGEKKFCVSKEGQLIDTGEVSKDRRAVNDAIKNIAMITGLNVQKVQAQVDADVKTTTKIEDMAKEILDV